jgi:ABC-type antimicrobial peptide transport system permease subunit
MLEAVLGVGTLITGLIVLWLVHLRTNQLGVLMKLEADLAKENLNHVADALVGLSELLNQTDEIIESASAIPTMGEMMQQMLMGFIAQKMQPVISPLDPTTAPLIPVDPAGPQHGETQSKKEIPT